MDILHGTDRDQVYREYTCDNPVINSLLQDGYTATIYKL